MSQLNKNFVSEKEVEDAKRKRQEEWEAVRKPSDPIDVPEAPVDNRSLYDRLKEQKDKKDLDYKESTSFKNLVRGLDDEEVGFLDVVDKIRMREEESRRKEELDLIQEYKAVSESESAMVAPNIFFTTDKKVLKSGKQPSKQAQMLLGAVKRRSSEETTTVAATKRPRISSTDKDSPAEVEDTVAPVKETNSSPSATITPNGVRYCAGVLPSAMKCVAILPGFKDYQHSSDDSSNSSDSDNDGGDTVIFPMAPSQVQMKRYADSNGESKCNSKSS